MERGRLALMEQMTKPTRKRKPRRLLNDDEWAQFWRHGSITTFERQGNPNYDGEIREFWERQFATLLEGARIVDLATGNGAVALLAAEYSATHGRQFRIDALDRASIRPDTDLKGAEAAQEWLSRVRFLGGAPNERTGLESECCDLVTSQYGFEYGDPAASAREATRILKPGGRIALITHHANSVVVREAREGLEQHRLCLRQEQLLIRARRVLDAMESAESEFEKRMLRHDTRAENLRRKLNAAVERVQQQANRFSDPGNGIGFVLKGLQSIFAAGLQAEQRRAMVRQLSEASDAYCRRMEDLLAATPDAGEFDRLLDHLRSAGLVVEGWFPLVYRGEALMGWAVAGHKPGKEEAAAME